MAIIANTYQSTSAAGKQNRETILTDLIYTTDPQETPLFSYIGRENVDGTKPEWLQTTLATPNPDNAQLEGDQYTYAAINQPARVSNYTQIARKEGIISNTQEAVSHVGKKDSARAKMERGIEIRRDIEASFLSNNASVGGATRKSAGLRAWIATNDSMGAGGASGGYNAGTGVVDAATNGSQRAFTKALMDAALLSAYTSGGKPTVAFMSPYVKSVFSGFMSDANVAQLRLAITNPRQQATIIGAADAYLSDWGLIDIVPNRIMALVGAASARNAFFVTPEYLASGFLRDIHEDPTVVSNADATPFVIIGEYTLVVKHEKAHAVVADLFGMSAGT